MFHPWWAFTAFIKGIDELSLSPTHSLSLSLSLDEHGVNLGSISRIAAHDLSEVLLAGFRRSAATPQTTSFIASD